MRIRDDVAFFQAVRTALSKRAASEGRTDEELDHAVRQIVSRAVAPEGVLDIFAAAGVDKPDVSILSEEFLAEVRGMQRRNLAVELLQKLLTGELATRRRKNVVQARSFADMIEQTIHRYRAGSGRRDAVRHCPRVRHDRPRQRHHRRDPARERPRQPAPARQVHPTQAWLPAPTSRPWPLTRCWNRQRSSLPAGLREPRSVHRPGGPPVHPRAQGPHGASGTEERGSGGGEADRATLDAPGGTSDDQAAGRGSGCGPRGNHGIVCRTEGRSEDRLQDRLQAGHRVLCDVPPASSGRRGRVLADLAVGPASCRAESVPGPSRSG